MKANSLNTLTKILIFTNVFAVLWLCFMMYANHYPVKNVVIGGIWELVTIPSFFFGVFNILFNAFCFVTRKWSQALFINAFVSVLYVLIFLFVTKSFL
ncbi:MAG: hypothetical protein KGV44_07500 [Flavobacteriaceae bacterium]|nr:hypothetical protein [Flavobacteriaceae bacterium]